MTTIVLPAFSGLRPTSIAAAMAAPDEMPTGMPSSRAVNRAMSKAVWLPTVTTSSITSRSRIAGTKPAPMPWILCGPGAPPVQDGRVLRLDRDHAHARLAALQYLADAGDRSAGADAGDDNIDFAVGVVPDFLRRRAAVNFRIGGILELLRHDRARRRSDDFVGFGDRALHALRGRGEDQLGAEQGQHLAAFGRHRFRHHQYQLVAAGRRHEGQRNAGVAGRRFDQNAMPGRNLALRLERIDHRHADAILDAADRIEELELGEQARFDAFFLGDAIDADERRIADRIRDRCKDFAAAWGARGVSCLGH